ncbi:hypothetical protein L596_005563 [Steinernema carpocapsae]|uniref:Uncharacterized protein n=1 Tax=Steinernema carpocapsae TaxID=34508 RepID=A0A4U8UZM9_STECR|nr:hypothetical protein L596_005563 [Steinernema carpocapsae]
MLWGCSSTNKALVARNNEARRVRLAKACELAEKLDEATANEIVSYDFNTLRGKLQDGSITAEQALQAYWRKAFQVNEDINCLIDVIVKAYDDAMELDRKPEIPEGIDEAGTSLLV